MYKATINKDQTFDITLNKDKTGGEINGETFKMDVSRKGDRHLHIIKNHKSINVEIISVDRGSKEGRVKVNGNIYDVVLRDEMDQLLESMGMEIGAGKAVSEIKAPMPGLVIELKVSEGDEVAKDEPLLVLEAMKMENVLKAPDDVVVDSIEVKAGQTIEKNTVLIKFK